MNDRYTGRGARIHCRRRAACAAACAGAVTGLGLTFISTGGATYGKGNGLLGFQASPKGCAVGARAADLTDCVFPDIATAKSNSSGGKKVIADGAQPTFSSSGQSLAHAGSAIGESDDGTCFSDEAVIFVVPSGGGTGKRVTKCEDGFDEEAPTFSPGGTRIAYESRASNSGNPPRIVSTMLDGTAPIVLTQDGTQPSWGANGRIVFVRKGDIWTMKGDGTDEVRLTKSKAADFSPDWSPGASRITFARNGEIYTLKSNANGLRRLTKNKTSEGDPVWPLTETGSRSPSAVSAST